MFKVELFDMYTNSFVSAFPLDRDATIIEDYISPRSFDITAPADIAADLRNTVYITSVEGRLGYTGSFFVSGIKRERTKTTLTISPLMLLLNEKSMQNTTYTDWARQIEQQIWYDFRQSTPSLYSVPWRPWTGGGLTYTAWDGVLATYGAELLNDMDCIILAATTYGKFMRFDTNIYSTYLGQPYYGFLKFTNTVTIEADLENILEKDIKETSRGSYNIAMYWYPQSAGSSSYYHQDGVLLNGTVQAATARLKAQIAEPRIIAGVTDNPTPAQADYEGFWKQNLKPSADSYEISLTVKVPDYIVRPDTMVIGQPVTIKSNGKNYSTFLTGREITRELVTLKFGTIRQSLTAQLNQEGI